MTSDQTNSDDADDGWREDDSDYWECIPYRIDGDGITLVFGLHLDESLLLLYAGGKLPDDEDLHALEIALQRKRHGSQPDIARLATIWPQAGRGYLGLPALAARRGDALLPVDLVLGEGSLIAGRSAHLVLEDMAAGVRVLIDWVISAGDVVRASSTILNIGDTALAIDRIASVALPLPGWATHATRFHGRWAGEMREDTAPIPHGRSGGESRGGRPGFDGANWLIAHEPGFAADHGLGIALHLAWSGDHETVIEHDADGAIVQIGARLDPGEVMLRPGARFTTPDAVMAIVNGGRNGVRRAMHRHLRDGVLPGRADWPARRVHLNSWEAVAFGMDDMRLARLADAAYQIGAERFVVDDGWFAGRRDDTTSLGDWTADQERFPKGLDRLIEYVGELDMDFGLWVEPEMVSPDSDLYRAHPDWCLHRTGFDRPTQRHQLMLDLARPAVSEHLYGKLNGLLSAHRIAYLKWDHNRELFPNDGVGHAQTLALYALIDRLRAAHPRVEIESCASGGGRIDYGMLSRCHRVWPSDNNDAIERLRINRAWNLFLPPEVMGNHVGPSPNPITGRMLPMDFRAKVAMFGHMGVEADPAAMSEADRETLAAHIACYKLYRELLHNGVVSDLSFEDPGLFGTMIEHQGRALALVARTEMAGDYNAPPVRFPGLQPDMRYIIAYPLGDHDDPPNGVWNWTLSGRMLAEAGIVLPLARPATAHIVYLERMDFGQ
ncbi:alpha-galactosidase [Sphingomonas sp. 28-63-12]|uniref:alpha-galactosidase n=1 Tax=Sphingomonas sp. 28-63-12 TaxID=1970434 RepID=UPI0035A85D85